MASKYFQFQPQEKIIAYLHSSFIAGLDKREFALQIRDLLEKQRDEKRKNVMGRFR